MSNQSPVRPKADPDPLYPLNSGNREGGIGGVEEVEDDMVRRAEELTKRIEELEDQFVREEGRRVRVAPVPEKPTEEEVAEHNITHTPPKPWCPHCTRATATRDPHKRIRKDVPDIEVPIDRVPR